MEKRFSFYELARYMKGNTEENGMSYIEKFAEDIGGVDGYFSLQYVPLTEMDVYGHGDDKKPIDYQWAMPSTRLLTAELKDLYTKINNKKATHVWVKVNSGDWIPQHIDKKRWRTIGRLKEEKRKYMWRVHNQLPCDYM